MAYPKTGTCWNVTYQGKTITVTVVDRAAEEDSYNLSEGALNKLTCAGLLILLSHLFADTYRRNNQAEFLGAVDGTGFQVAKSLCGL